MVEKGKELDVRKKSFLQGIVSFFKQIFGTKKAIETEKVDVENNTNVVQEQVEKVKNEYTETVTLFNKYENGEVKLEDLSYEQLENINNLIIVKTEELRKENEKLVTQIEYYKDMAAS